MRNRSWWSIMNRYEKDSAMDIKQNQGKISGVQLENYRRNSETREPLEEEDQSSSSSSRLICKEFFLEDNSSKLPQVEDEGCGGKVQPDKTKAWQLERLPEEAKERRGGG